MNAWPAPDDAHRLFADLLAGHADAPAEFAAALLPPLCAWVAANHPRDDEHLCAEAAADAVLSLYHKPTLYDPARGLDVAGFLRMAAAADLANALRKERRHRHISLDAVELSPDGGKYLGRTDDPSLNLRIAEEGPTVPDAVRTGLTPEQNACLDLLLAGVRPNDEYAKVLGLIDRPKAERDREIKRVKDMLKKRIARAGGGDEPPR